MSKQALAPLVLLILGGSAAYYFLSEGGGDSGALSRGTEEPREGAAEGDEALQPVTPSEAEPARELRGRVVMPAGAPADEELWITASAGEPSFETRVAAGAFQLSLPAHVESGTLALRARYLSIGGVREFDALDPDIEWTLHVRNPELPEGGEGYVELEFD